MPSTNMSIRIDSEVKAQAEKVLSQLGMTMNGTINMFLQQIIRDQAVPLSLSLNTDRTLYSDLLYAETERSNGFIGRTADSVLEDMDRIIRQAGES